MIDKINDRESLIVHFDIAHNKHEIPIAQSIVTEQSIEIIVIDIIKNLFGDSLNYDIVVYANEEGGVIKTYGLMLGVFVISQMFPDTINGVLRGLTGNDWSYYSEQITVAIVDSVKGFVEKDDYYLNNFCSYDQFYKAYKAKNNFYKASIENKDILGIGFTKENNFPIKRSQFYYKIVDLESKLLPLDPVDKYHKLRVVSQINTLDEKDRAWFFKDYSFGGGFYAYMKDDKFVEFLASHHLYLDSLIVKTRYYLKRDENGNVVVDKKEIMKVYEYNDNTFILPPEDFFIEKAPWLPTLLNNQDVLSLNDGNRNNSTQYSLFDDS